jgi:hypothetical protein
MHIGLGRRFGGAGAPRDLRRHDRLRRLGGLQALVAPRLVATNKGGVLKYLEWAAVHRLSASSL